MLYAVVCTVLCRACQNVNKILYVPYFAAFAAAEYPATKKDKNHPPLGDRLQLISTITVPILQINSITLNTIISV